MTGIRSGGDQHGIDRSHWVFTGLLVMVVLSAPLAGCLDLLGDGPASPPGNRPNATASQSLGGFSETDVFPGDYDTTGEHSRTLEEGPYEVAEPEVVNLTSDVDGTNLKLELIHPEGPDDFRTPVITLASPYLQVWDPREPPQEQSDDLRADGYRYHHPSVALLIENFVPHGYTVALVPVRGTADVGGCMDVWGPKEQADIDQIATWLGDAEWSNGQVGFYGLSYDGTTAWEAAASGNPHVETIVPIAGVPNALELAYPNGTYVEPTSHPPVFHALAATLYLPPFDIRPANTDPASRAAQRVVCPEAVRGVAATLGGAVTRGAGPMGYWEARNHQPSVEDHYNGSVLHVQGLQDGTIVPSNAYPWVSGLDEHNITVKQIIGQWDHTVPYQVEGSATPRWDWAEILLHWFDYWLKDETSVDLGPRVQVADEQGRWRSGTDWPPAHATPKRFHLTPNGSLSPQSADDEDSIPVATTPDGMASRVFRAEERSLPARVERCRSCPVFESAPLDDTLRFAGRPSLDVTVVPQGPGGYLSARLFDEGPNGSLDPITGGQINFRFADGDGDPERVTPAQPLAVNLTLDPVDVVVERDHRLRLKIDQAFHKPNDAYPDPPIPFTLGVGGGQSTLTLETFDTLQERFFDPPG